MKAKDISAAAADAVKVVADAAKEAAKTVADAAAAALKVTSIQGANDHDLIVELKTKIEAIRDDIKDLKTGTTEKIADHEIRINSLEAESIKKTILLSVGIGIMTLLVSLLVWHLVGR